MSRLIKIYFITLIFISSFHFKAIAEPTFVQSKLIDDKFYLGLNFNNDGTKMYTVNADNSTAPVSYTHLTLPTRLLV